MKSLGFRARPPLAPPASWHTISEASLPSWAPPGPPSPPASHPAPSQGASRKGFRHWPATKMSPHSPKIHEKSLSWSQHPPKQFPRCPSHPSQAPKECRKPIKTLCFSMVFAIQTICKTDTKMMQKATKSRSSWPS